MGLSLFPLKDALPIPQKTKKSLKKQMARWLRRQKKRRPEEALKMKRHRGWFW
jgi:hypothetical protein